MQAFMTQQVFVQCVTNIILENTFLVIQVFRICHNCPSGGLLDPTWLVLKGNILVEKLIN